METNSKVAATESLARTEDILIWVCDIAEVVQVK